VTSFKNGIKNLIGNGANLVADVIDGESVPIAPGFLGAARWPATVRGSLRQSLKRASPHRQANDRRFMPPLRPAPSCPESWMGGAYFVPILRSNSLASFKTSDLQRPAALIGLFKTESRREGTCLAARSEKDNSRGDRFKSLDRTGLETCPSRRPRTSKPLAEGRAVQTGIRWDFEGAQTSAGGAFEGAQAPPVGILPVGADSCEHGRNREKH
jgi:hypothetical protein